MGPKPLTRVWCTGWAGPSTRACEPRTTSAQPSISTNDWTSPQAVELEALNDDFEDAVKDCERREKDLAERIEAIRGEADELVDGWNEELTQFSGETMRKKSEAMLRDTEARGQRVLTALERVQSRMKPVLFKLQDYALFFHHNLNARAIATLEDTYKDFDSEFRALESELARAESEIAAFLANFVQPEPIAPSN